MLNAAKRLEPLDVGLARETYLEALQAAMFVGRLARGCGVLEVAQAARHAPASSQPPRIADLLLDGLTLRATEGYLAGTPILRRALSTFRNEQISGEEALRWLWLASRTAVDLWDDETWDVLSTRHVQLARDAGALTVLPMIELAVAVLEQPDQLSAGVVFDHAGQSGHQRRHLQAVSLHGDDERFERHLSTVAPAGSVPHPAVA